MKMSAKFLKYQDRSQPIPLNQSEVVNKGGRSCSFVDEDIQAGWIVPLVQSRPVPATQSFVLKQPVWHLF